MMRSHDLPGWNRAGWAFVSAAFVLGTAGFALADDAPGKAAASAPASAPAATTAAASRAASQDQHEPTMRFSFVNAPVQSVLSEMATRLGFQVIQTAPVDGNITIHVPEPVTADEAVQLLNSILIPMHYAALDDSIELPSQTIRILRVMPIKDAMKLAPVGEFKAGS